MRRCIRRLNPGCKVDIADLETLMQNEVLKRDLFDGDEAKQAAEFLKKAARALDRAKAKAAAEADVADAAVKDPVADPGERAA